MVDEEVEDEHCDVGILAAHSRLQRAEVGAALGVDDDDLPVEEHAVELERRDGARDGRKASRPVEAFAGVDPHLVPIRRDDGAVAVELDLEQPVRALGHVVDQGRELGLDEGGEPSRSRRPLAAVSSLAPVLSWLASRLAVDPFGIARGDGLHAPARRHARRRARRGRRGRAGPSSSSCLMRSQLSRCRGRVRVAPAMHADERPIALEALAVEDER